MVCSMENGYRCVKDYGEIRIMKVLAVGLDNINDYYYVNLKYARLGELEIDRDEFESNNSKLFFNHSFMNIQEEGNKL